jgi:hypothetical protein
MIGGTIVKRLVPRGFEALNRHDLDAFLARWTEDATFVYPRDVSASGSWKGKQAVREWFQRFFEPYFMKRMRYSFSGVVGEGTAGSMGPLRRERALSHLPIAGICLASGVGRISTSLHKNTRAVPPEPDTSPASRLHCLLIRPLR